MTEKELKEHFDKILEDMNKPGVAEKMKKCFDMTEKELNEALLEIYKKKKNV